MTYIGRGRSFNNSSPRLGKPYLNSTAHIEENVLAYKQISHTDSVESLQMYSQILNELKKATTGLSTLQLF